MINHITVCDLINDHPVESRVSIMIDKIKNDPPAGGQWHGHDHGINSLYKQVKIISFTPSIIHQIPNLQLAFYSIESILQNRTFTQPFSDDTYSVGR